MKNDMLKIASWNICLGISNKLFYIENLLNQEKIDILFIQEAEIQMQTDLKHYKIENFKLITSGTLNSGKSRLCCYIKDDIIFTENEVANKTLELISIKIHCQNCKSHMCK